MGGISLTYCLVWERSPLLNGLRSLGEQLTARFLSILQTQTAARADGDVREAANRQAERLLDDYGDRILRLAYSYLQNREDAEEILQDTLVQFLKTAPTLESREHEKAWLLRVAANLSKNRLKYNALRRTDQLAEELVSEDREDLSFVWEAVKALPLAYREVIHLFYQEGYSTGEIAGLLGQREATIRSRLARGREKLKAILGEAYDFDEKV